MTNELMILMKAALDTSRNGILIAMCYLIKNEEARTRVREEIKAFLQFKNLDPGA